MGDYDDLMAFGNATKDVAAKTDPYADLMGWKTPESSPPAADSASGRPADFLGRLKFAAQHPIESLKDEIPKALEGGQAAADTILNTATLGAYRQVRDARNVPEALSNTAPPSARTLETARFNEAHPAIATGAELAGTMVGGPKMLAEAGGALLGPVVRAADNAIGRKALDIVTRPETPAGPVAKVLKKGAERIVHGAIGHSIGGVPGAIASQVASPYVHDAMVAAGDKITNRLASRYLRNLPRAAAADSGLLPLGSATTEEFGRDLLSAADAPSSGHKVVQGADIPSMFGIDLAGARQPLAPLVSRPPAIPTELPPGFPRGPLLDDFTGAPVTNGGRLAPLGNHATHGGATNPGGRLPPDLEAMFRADVARDAKAFAAAPPDAPAVNDVLGDRLAASVRILDDLRAGKITVDEAVKAGLPRGVAQRAVR